MTYVWAALIGTLSGVCSGLFGVGGGIVMIPAMVILLQMDMKRAVGTSLLVIIPTAMVGSFKHFRNGNVDGHLAALIIPAALVTGYLGAWLTQHIASASLRRGFGVFLVGIGIYLVLGRFPSTSEPTPSTPAPPPPAGT